MASTPNPRPARRPNASVAPRGGRVGWSYLLSNGPLWRLLLIAIAIGFGLGVKYVQATTQALSAVDSRRHSGDPCLTFIRPTTGSDATAVWSNLGDCPSAPRDRDREMVAVDLRYGLLLYYKTEAVMSTLPFPFTLVLRNQDNRSRAFGMGGTHTYDMALVGDAQTLSWVDLVLAGGGRIHYVKTQPGRLDAKVNGYFRDTTLQWTGQEWRLRRDDHTELLFPESRRAFRLEQAALVRMQAASEEPLLTIDRDSLGNIQSLNMGDGQVTFDHDDQNRLTSIATAGSAKPLRFSYDAGDCLDRRTGLDGEYVYEQDHGISGCQLRRSRHDGVISFEAKYDDSDRVIRVTDPAGHSYTIWYETDRDGRIITAELSDQTGMVRRIAFDKDRYSFIRSGTAGRK